MYDNWIKKIMEEVKYIYFEVHYLSQRYTKPEKTIQNENILVNKPRTNSIGYWGFRSMTKRHPRPGVVEENPVHYVVEQNWIDLTKLPVNGMGAMNITTANLIELEDAVKAVKNKLKIK